MFDIYMFCRECLLQKGKRRREQGGEGILNLSCFGRRIRM